MMRVLLTAAVLVALSTAAMAGPKDYQVTGPILDLTADTITVQKGKDKWEIGRGPATKVTGDLKKGDKVTIMYSMTATSIESKAAAAPAKKK